MASIGRAVQSSLVSETSGSIQMIPLVLAAVSVALTLFGFHFWLLVADLNLDAFFGVARRLIDARNWERLLKLVRSMPDNPALAVINQALTLDPTSLRDPTSAPEGYRHDAPIDRDAITRARLRALGGHYTKRGELRWRLAAAGVLPAFGVFVTLGPWTNAPGNVAWTLSVAALACFALLTLQRARVLRKLERVVTFITPHAGALSQRERGR